MSIVLSVPSAAGASCSEHMGRPHCRGSGPVEPAPPPDALHRNACRVFETLLSSVQRIELEGIWQDAEKLDFCAIHRDQLSWHVGVRIARRMRKKAVQQGRREVHGEKNNERHVCGRRRDGEPAMSSK